MDREPSAGGLTRRGGHPGRGPRFPIENPCRSGGLAWRGGTDRLPAIFDLGRLAEILHVELHCLLPHPREALLLLDGLLGQPRGTISIYASINSEHEDGIIRPNRLPDRARREGGCCADRLG